MASHTDCNTPDRLSRCLENKFSCLLNETGDSDELYIGTCRFLVLLMKNYDKLPRDHIRSCLVAIIGVLRLGFDDSLD